MVGVARIELATPAMSTRRTHGFLRNSACLSLGSSTFPLRILVFRSGAWCRLNKGNSVGNRLFATAHTNAHEVSEGEPADGKLASLNRNQGGLLAIISVAGQ